MPSYPPPPNRWNEGNHDPRLGGISSRQHEWDTGPVREEQREVAMCVHLAPNRMRGKVLVTELAQNARRVRNIGSSPCWSLRSGCKWPRTAWGCALSRTDTLAG